MILEAGENVLAGVQHFCDTRRLPKHRAALVHLARITLQQNTLDSFIAKLLIKTYKVHKQTHIHSINQVKGIASISLLKFELHFHASVQPAAFQRFSLSLSNKQPLSWWQLLTVAKKFCSLFQFDKHDRNYNKSNMFSSLFPTFPSFKHHRLAIDIIFCGT